MLHFHFNNKYMLSTSIELDYLEILELIDAKLRLQKKSYYLICNGKIVTDHSILDNGIIHIVPRLPGGKGGFGSMLRAIGAQIEKTTNREACRDLSGRRLRDINEEKRLKAWIDRQATREQEAADVKQKKLERLCRKPKHEFKDESYDKERSELPDRLEDAVTQGLTEAASSSKRKHEPEKRNAKKNKRTMWLDDDLDELPTSDDDKTSSDDELANEKCSTLVNHQKPSVQDANQSSSCNNESKIVSSECESKKDEIYSSTEEFKHSSTGHRNENDDSAEVQNKVAGST